MFTYRPIFSFKQGYQTKTVFRFVIRKLHSKNLCEGGDQIRLVNQLLICPWLERPRNG